MDGSVSGKATVRRPGARETVVARVAVQCTAVELRVELVVAVLGAALTMKDVGGGLAGSGAAEIAGIGDGTVVPCVEGVVDVQASGIEE